MTEPRRDARGPLDRDDEPEYEIHRAADPGDPVELLPGPRRRPAAVWAAAAVLVVLAAVGIWMVVGRRPADPPPSQSRADQPLERADAPSPLGAAAFDRDIPPLEESDAVVRELVRQLTGHPTVAAWLATDGLIRNFTVSAANIADGVTPVRQMSSLRPASSFAVKAQGEALIVDPASYRRYDTIAAAAASISPEGAARLYGTLKPRIAEAYRELGEPQGDPDRVIERAIVQLLRTPVVDGPVQVAVSARGIGYVFADARLEALTPPQKQLLRMGPANVRTIQRALRDIAVAMGIPAARLPPA